MLKEMRQEKGMTQKELSLKANVSLQMIQHYEQGYRDLNKVQAYTLYKLAKALGCKMEDLIKK